MVVLRNVDLRFLESQTLLSTSCLTEIGITIFSSAGNLQGWVGGACACGAQKRDYTARVAELIVGRGVSFDARC